MCKLEMEDEYHFCMPRLPEKKKKKVIFNNSKNATKWNIHVFHKSPNQKPETQKLKATQVFECFTENKKRN